MLRNQTCKRPFRKPSVWLNRDPQAVGGTTGNGFDLEDLPSVKPFQLRPMPESQPFSPRNLPNFKLLLKMNSSYLKSSRYNGTNANILPFPQINKIKIKKETEERKKHM